MSEKIKFPYTDEQLDGINTEGDTILFVAPAGSGKTTLLEGYAKARPFIKMIYIAFNASVRDQAKLRFPSNVRSMTGHGCAYTKYGRVYGDKIDKLNNPKPFHIANMLGLDSKAGNTVLQVVLNFLVSADHTISEKNVLPYYDGSAKQIQNVIKLANQVWDVMKDPDDLRIPIPHDGYLKLFHLGGDIIDYPLIMVDEFQDTNPVLLDIVMRSPGKKVFVGDPNQSIYAFRGAINAMDHVEYNEKKHLTASFRFGQGIADIANKIIGYYTPLEKQIKGLGKHKTEFSLDPSQNHTRLSRTNASLFDESVKALMSGRPFGFVGGVENYKFNMILDAYYLYSRENSLIRDVMIKSFQSFPDMKVYAESVDDKELKSLVRVVEVYGRQIPNLILEVKDKAKKKDQLDEAEIILTTAHKAKGLEWDNVYLCNDFTTMLPEKDEEGKETNPDQQEINLLYVACTRAGKCLSLYPELDTFLHQNGMSHAVKFRNDEIPSKNEKAKLNESQSNSKANKIEMNQFATNLLSQSEGLKNIIRGLSATEAEKIALMQYVQGTEALMLRATGRT